MTTFSKTVQRGKKDRPTFGFIVSWGLSNSYSGPMWWGAVKAAEELGVNLIGFGSLNLWRRDLYKNMYQIAQSGALDGLIVVNPDFTQLEDVFGDLPVVNISKHVDHAVMSIMVDNHAGMYAAISHLIEVHGRKRLAFLKGPATNNEAQMRYKAYEDALRDHGLPFDPELAYAASDITAEGWTPEAGRYGARFLLERGIQFDALIAANDDMALAALEELQSHNVRVPYDVSLVGFDDIQKAQTSTPSMTTIRQPLDRMGRVALEALVAHHQGKSVAHEMTFPAETMVRRSCGCFSESVRLVDANLLLEPASGESASQPELAASLDACRSTLLSLAAEAHWDPGLMPTLLDGLQSDLQSANHEDQLLKTIDFLAREMMDKEQPVTGLQDPISALRREGAKALAPWPGLLHRAENLWHRARVFLNDIVMQEQTQDRQQLVEQMAELRNISQLMAVTFETQGLMDILARDVKQLGIHSSFVTLYEGSERPAPLSRLILASHHDNRTILDENGLVYSSESLLPSNAWPDTHLILTLQALEFQQEELGYVLFEVGPHDGAIYDALRGQLSSALKGATLMKHVAERAVQLQTSAEVSRAASSILDPRELLQSIVEVIQQRFGLYYVGIFLIDQSGRWTGEPNRWAVLRAGTGEAGQKMLERNYKLSVNEDSLISICMKNQQARVLSEADAEAVLNPMLPKTRSELALPLVARGQVIGAMSVQSEQVAAFSENDVAILQTMADQLANAIENAHLFEQTQQRTQELTQAKNEADKARYEAETAQAKAEAERLRAETEKERAEAASRDLENKIWQTSGQAQLNDRMRGEQDIETLSANVIQQLCRYLDAPTGALYLVRDASLYLAGAFAYRQSHRTISYQMGEGLIGQSALERKPMTLRLPQEYVLRGPVSVGDISPRYFLVAPFVYDNQTIGVVEVGALVDFTPAQLEFINHALESVAIAFLTAQARVRVNELYAKTRQQAEELQAQEEELRATNEELEAQAENLRANQAALRAANQELEEKAAILQKQQQMVDQQNRELERKAEELAQASKYKSEFLANMSHELRTPLNSMLILAGMLARNDEGNLTSDQVESVQVIQAGGADLLNLINEILDLAKVEAGKMEFHFAPMPWSILTERMEAQFNPLAVRKGVGFVVELDGSLPSEIVTDHVRLAQIIKNLLSNAFKFTERGQVTLRIAPPAAGIDLSASGPNSGQVVAISVSDTGIGMTPAQQKVVFEAFTQADGSTSRQYGGTGLGLTITREMTQRLGGQVHLTSEHGKGSTFTIYLPIQPGESVKASISAGEVEVPHPGGSPEKTHPTNSQKQRAPSSAGRDYPAQRPHPTSIAGSDRLLLVVEDDPNFARLIRDYAEKKNFTCLLAEDGETGLTMARQYRPAAIILDIRLPGMSGWDVLTILKDDPDLRHIPVHFMSAENETLSAYQRGAIGFLTKPPSQATLDGAFDRIESFISNKIRSLLVVEDDPSLRLSVRKLLEGSDVVISEASSGQAAIQALREKHFDCMILDLSLPDLSGFELLQELDIDDSIPKCPVIVYTGKELTPEENQELLKYAESVIVKGARSPERLQDETALFLHRVIADMPEEKRQVIQKLHNRDSILQEKQILIVDDDSRNAFALSKLLNEKGIKMHIASSATKALEMLEKINVNLILTDIMMPGMDGYEFIRALRQKPTFHRLPIIALTAKAMKGDREKCLEAGANDYLSKPIEPDRLISMLRVWLSKEA